MPSTHHHWTMPFAFRIRTLFFVMTIAALMLGTFVWVNRWRSLVISDDDLTKPQRYELATRFGASTSVSLRVSGHIGGRAVLEMSDDSLPTSTMTIGPGDVSIAMDRLDHYSRFAVITYTPENVKGGRLQIRYRFGYF